MTSKTATEVARSLDHEKIVALESRVKQLSEQNEELRSSYSSTKRDSRDVMSYFQREIALKDDLLSQLQQEIATKEHYYEQKLKEQTSTFESELEEQKKRSQEAESSLRSKIRQLEEDMVHLERYREDHDSFERQLETLQSNLRNKDIETVTQLERQERRFYEEKAKMQHQIDNMSEKMREEARIEAMKNLSRDTRNMLRENQRMREELSYQNAASTELQREKEKADQEIKRLKRSLALSESEIKQMAVMMNGRTKEANSLRSQLQELKEELSAWKRNLKQERKRIESSIRKEVDESVSEAAALKSLLQHKNKELVDIKRLSQDILDQRNEVEEFFLQSLQYVKQKVLEERKKSRIQTLHQYNSINKQMMERGTGGHVQLPKLSLHQMRLFNHNQEQEGSTSNQESKKEEKVFIQDLSWTEKEKVLRILFAKINNIQRERQPYISETTRHSFQPIPSSSARQDNQETPVFTTEGKID